MGAAGPARPVGSQVDAGLVGTGSGQNRIMAGAAGPPALESPAVPARPRRQLSAGAMLLPGVDHPVPQKARRRDYRRNHKGKGQENCQAFRIGQGYDPHYGERGEHAYPRPHGRFRQRPGGRAGLPGSSRPSGDWPGVEVAGDRGQFLRVRRGASLWPVMTASLSRRFGWFLCPPMFNHDEAAALASLQALARLSADVVLPGHGPSPARRARHRRQPRPAKERIRSISRSPFKPGRCPAGCGAPRSARQACPAARGACSG